MQEIWKSVKGYENLYEISNYGRVKSLKRQGTHEHILKQFDNSNGYMIVSLSKDNVQKTFPVHKLVANTFMNNTDSLRDINHIDGNKKNNYIDNLEFCSHSYNMKHAFKLGLNKTQHGYLNPNAKKIIQYDLKGNYIKTWDCIIDAMKEYNICRSSIHRCCTGVFKQTHGYIWRYAD